MRLHKIRLYGSDGPTLGVAVDGQEEAANATSRKCRRCGCLEQVRAAREEAEAN